MNTPRQAGEMHENTETTLKAWRGSYHHVVVWQGTTPHSPTRIATESELPLPQHTMDVRTPYVRTYMCGRTYTRVRTNGTVPYGMVRTNIGTYMCTYHGMTGQPLRTVRTGMGHT
jgi:hypothetical protein